MTVREIHEVLADDKLSPDTIEQQLYRMEKDQLVRRRDRGKFEAA